MRLIINGQWLEVPSQVQTIADLLVFYELGEKRPIVEHNQKIIEQPQHHQAKLVTDDRVEIVHFVGGG